MQQEEQQTEHHSQDTQPVLWSLANGLQVVCLPLKYVEYVAADIILPGGVINDPEGKAGSSLLLAELLSRGVGTMSSQELLTAFDDHGIRHGESGSSLSLSLRSSFLPQETKRALELMSMMLREPSFPEEAVDPVKALFLHDLRSVRENPSRWAMLELSNRYFPAPFNKSPLGEEEDILSLTQSALKEQWFGRFGPKGAVLSVAGRVDVDELKGAIEQYFSPWKGECEEIPELTEFPKRRSVYLNYPGAQQQLLFRYPSPP
ncbi:MAG: insulinase family protein, partial [Bdellovibrionales bacterium]|nr:insulinase family protein [Bdellovibrionales bacterium]